MTTQKKGRIHVHEKKWTDPKKEKKRKKKDGCMSMNKSGWTPTKKNKKIKI